MFNKTKVQAQVESAEKLMQKDTEARTQQTEKMSGLYQRLEESGFNIEDQEAFDTDFENASLGNIKNTETAMNNNIARLINLLDETTTSLGDEFNTMRDKTMGESVVGFFSSNKADEMRAERISSASVEQNLTDLIAQSNSITVLLQGQLEDLEGQMVVGQDNLELTIQKRADVVKELESVTEKLQELDPVIMAKEEQRNLAETPAERTALDTEIQALNVKFNDFKDQEAVLTNQSMTLERYVALNKSSVDSLQNQVTTQKVLIQKLKTDTSQRNVIYSALETSLKTAEQQETAHKINQIGVKTDEVVQKTQAAIGAGSNNALAEMMEGHQGQMAEANRVQAEKLRADEMFNRRFGTVVEDQANENY